MIFIDTRLSVDSIGRAYCKLQIKERHSEVMTPLNFKIDTGADFTTISRTALFQLGYDRRWMAENKRLLKSKVITLAAGERVNTYFVKLPLVNFCGYQAVNWPFAVILDDAGDYRQLLGLDLLAYFNLKVDNDNGFYELSHVMFKPELEVFFGGQDIYKINPAI